LTAHPEARLPRQCQKKIIELILAILLLPAARERAEPRHTAPRERAVMRHTARESGDAQSCAREPRARRAAARVSRDGRGAGAGAGRARGSERQLEHVERWGAQCARRPVLAVGPRVRAPCRTAAPATDGASARCAGASARCGLRFAFWRFERSGADCVFCFGVLSGRERTAFGVLAF